MTEEASNAFLKTLEEPPPGNILILKAVEPLDLLPTIVSRCQKVPFQPLPPALIRDTLLKARGALQKEAAEVLARLAGGSLGWALNAAAGGFLERRQEWLAGAVQISSLSAGEIMEMAIIWARKNSSKDEEVSGPLPEGLNGFLLVWASWYRDLMLLKAGVGEDLLTNFDFSRKLKNLAGKYSMEALSSSLEALEQAKLDLSRNRNPSLVMEYTLLRLKQLNSQEKRVLQ
jgi:DNA polymerase-3 subunit delta'